MMPLPIARGRISHTVASEVGWLARAMIARLDDSNDIQLAQEAFSSHIGRSSCTIFPLARTAVWATLKELNHPVGSRVIMPPITIKPILDVVVHLGYEPVFVDIDPTTACFDHHDLQRAMATRPSVAILTYLFGLVPDVGGIMKIFRENGVFVIEDFSQCLNGEFNGRRIGSFGDVAIYSASSVKTFDTFGGGFALTDDPRFIKGLRRRQSELDSPSRANLLLSIMRNLVRNLASSRLLFPVVTFWLLRLAARMSIGGVERFTGARSTEPLAELPPAWFRRYTSLQARVAVRELPKVASRDARRVKFVEQIVADSGVSDWTCGSHGQRHVHWQFIVYVKDFAEARKKLAKFGVDCATTSLVLLTNLPKYPGQRVAPMATRLYERGVYLPCYHQLRDGELARIAAALRELVVVE